MKHPDQLIIVCAHCKRASCWQGIFYCPQYQNAGTIQMRRKDLRRLALEHPSYWKTDRELARQ